MFPTVETNCPQDIVAETLSIALTVSCIEHGHTADKANGDLLLLVGPKASYPGTEKPEGTVWIDRYGRFELGATFQNPKPVLEAVTRLFEPSSARACNMQLRRIGVRSMMGGGARVEPHPGTPMLFGVFIEAADRLPLWTPPRTILLPALIDVKEKLTRPMFGRLMRRVVGWMVERPVEPNLDGYPPSVRRWWHAEAVNRHLARIGVPHRADPGEAGDTERVAIKYGEPMDDPRCGVRLESLPAWRIPQDVLLPALADVPPGTRREEVEVLLDKLQGDGPVDLSDWRPSSF